MIRLSRSASVLTVLGLIGLLAALSAQEATAQALYQPRAVKRAYVRHTRSPDGRPGAAYWQNHGRYTITVTAAPPARAIYGTEQIVYTNNSPDTLRRLVFKLLVNIHKPGAARAGNAGADYLTSGVHVDSFAANGHKAAWPPDANVFTSQFVALPAPLMPHDSVHLALAWHYDMSRQSGREGAIDSTTFYLAYFYPRVAVYDDYNGWDTYSFDDRLEFYSDFNDYDVTVQAPANYVVWGTGTLQNPADVLQPAIAERLRQSLTSDTTIRVATAADLSARRVTAQQAMNAWHFTATNVPDMTFAMSDHYDWDATSVVVDDATGRRASAQAAYNDTAADYHQMARYAAHGLQWLSRNWPGVPYPYEKTTVVEGFAGMEYPMMVNDESYADTTFSRFVAEHEIAHTWFPFYMGINETRHAFMDEGWATTFEYLVSQADLGPAKAADNFRQFRVDGWTYNPPIQDELPIVTPYASGDNGYVKPALGYLALKEMLGDSLFRAGLHAYMDRWHGKHPIPWDFFNSFNSATGRNLDWFWQGWFFSTSYIDFAVGGVTRTARGWQVVIDNVGGMPAPVDLNVGYSDGSSATLRQSAAVWKANPRRTTVVIPTKKRITSVALAGGIWMDADSTNNRWGAAPRAR